MFLQALCAKHGPHELKLSEFYVINAFAVKLVCHFLCGKENLSCAKVCLCAWLVTENLVCIHRLAVVSKPLCSRPRWRRTRVFASIMCLRCSNSLLAYWQTDFKKHLLCRIHEQISWSQKICLCGWGFSVAWNISFCLSIFPLFLSVEGRVWKTSSGPESYPDLLSGQFHFVRAFVQCGGLVSNKRYALNVTVWNRRNRLLAKKFYWTYRYFVFIPGPSYKHFLKEVKDGGIPSASEELRCGVRMNIANSKHKFSSLTAI